jgi:choice-of-anchor A domain-containing protein
MNMIQWAKIGILALAICLAGTSAQALSLGTAGDYNVFVFGDYSGSNSDVQGRLAADGNVSLQSYGVGDKLPANSGDVLVAGGDLTITNGQIYYGNAVVGGNATLSGVGVPDGSVTSGASVPVDFSAERDYLTGLSNTLSQMSATGTTSSPWSGALSFQGDNASDLQVFNISGSELSSTNTFNFLDDTMIPTDATLVFNISGSSVGMGNFDMQGFKNLLGESWDNVLFNFYEAEELNLYSIGIYGSILAPLADITTGYGQINGTVVAKSWTGPMQVNYGPFDGDSDTPPAPVPEPATLLLLGSGLLGLMGAKRKKRG